MDSDRQFCRTVCVISWTVALILSSRKIVNLEHVFVSFQDFVGKTRNFSVWSLARFSREEGYTWHKDFEHNRKSNIGNSVHWWIVSHQWIRHIAFFWIVTYSWMGGIRRIEQTNLKLTELCASQWYICQAELKEVNFEQICWQCHCHWKHFDSIGELLSSLEITNSKFSTSELLITSEIVEHCWIFESKEHHTKIWQREHQLSHMTKRMRRQYLNYWKKIGITKTTGWITLTL